MRELIMVLFDIKLWCGYE